MKWYESATAVIASAIWLLSLSAGWANLGWARMVREWSQELGELAFVVLTGAALFVTAKTVQAMVKRTSKR